MKRICSGCRSGTGFEVPFTMAFQPIVDVPAATVFAYEALVRGVDGAGAAAILSSVTDENRYAFDQACRVKAIASAMCAGLADSGAMLSINFLPNAVYSPLACIQLTLAAAASAMLPVDRIIFEFTETEMMTSTKHVMDIIETYKNIGFKVAIDDFGAGHSGLDMFANFEPDEVKLDMELIRGIATDRRRQAIVRAIARMCDELETVMIAEGVETHDEAQALLDLGVRYQQGYLYGKPLIEKLAELPGWLLQ
ncbi:EAL domain-containing protein [Sphingomonas sp. R1]|nr:EAL domain-containing protein [Sphingomonas sp. R1]